MDKSTSFSGPSFFLEGLRLIFDPALRWFVLWPLLINIIVFSGIMYWTSLQFSGWMDSIMGGLPNWLSFLEYLLWPVFVLGLLGVVFFTFTIVGNLIASPFNAMLSEKVQRMEGAELPDMALKDWLVILPKSIGRELRKLQYYLPRALLLLVLSFIPVVNLAAPVLWFLFNGWMMAVQYCDYAADNRMVSFTDMMGRLKQNTSGVWTFGATVSLVMLVPLVNLLIMPAAVIGSTLLWERRIESTTGR